MIESREDSVGWAQGLFLSRENDLLLPLPPPLLYPEVGSSPSKESLGAPKGHDFCLTTAGFCSRLDLGSAVTQMGCRWPHCVQAPWRFGRPDVSVNKGIGVVERAGDKSGEGKLVVGEIIPQRSDVFFH